MAIDFRGHTVPGENEFINFNAINDLSKSINDIRRVANLIEAEQYITDLTAAGIPTAGAQVFVVSENQGYVRQPESGGWWARLKTTADDDPDWVVLQTATSSRPEIKAIRLGRQVSIYVNGPLDVQANHSARFFSGMPGKYRPPFGYRSWWNMDFSNLVGAPVTGFGELFYENYGGAARANFTESIITYPVF